MVTSDNHNASQIVLSILIPTYNRVENLTNQLKRIKEQIPADVRIQVVVCDNSDEEYMVPEELSFIDYSFNKENIGLSGNVKKLISLAKGRYAWLLSDDDNISIDAIKEILLNINNYKDKNVGLCLIESSSSYQGKKIKNTVYFNELKTIFFKSKMEAFKEIYKAVFFLVDLGVNKSTTNIKNKIKSGANCAAILKA